MDFSFTEEQEILRDSVRAFLRDHYSFESRRSAVQSEAGWRPELWRRLADDLGLLGLTLPKRLDGLAADPVTTMIVMQELGQALVVEPYLETIVIGSRLMEQGGGQFDTVLRAIGSGEAVTALAWAEPASRYSMEAVATSATRDGSGWRLNGTKSVVTAAPWATHLLVTARTSGASNERHGVSLFVVDPKASGVRLSSYPTIDGRRAADVAFDNVQLAPESLLGAAGAALDLLDPVLEEAIAALSAEAIGVMNRLLADTVEYTKQRKQFGQPIASFQVLQHRMVDMFMEIELAQAAMYLVTLKLSAPPLERSLAASAAKVAVSKACRYVGQNAVQLHGGMGMTDDLAVAHYFKRATVIEAEFGTADYHLARHARLSRTAA